MAILRKRDSLASSDLTWCPALSTDVEPHGKSLASLEYEADSTRPLVATFSFS